MSVNPKPFKFVLNDKIIRVDEDIQSFEELKNKAYSLLEINRNLHNINIFYIDNDMLSEIADTKSFMEAINGHTENTHPKFKIFLEGKNVDEMLSNLEVCSSMMVVENNCNANANANTNSDNQNEGKDSLSKIKGVEVNEKAPSQGNFNLNENEKELICKIADIIKTQKDADDGENLKTSVGQFNLLSHSFEDYSSQITNNVDVNKQSDDDKFKQNTMISCDLLIENFKLKHELGAFVNEKIKLAINKTAEKLQEKFKYFSYKVLSEIIGVTASQFLELQNVLSKKLNLKSDSEDNMQFKDNQNQENKEKEVEKLVSNQKKPDDMIIIDKDEREVKIDKCKIEKNLNYNLESANVLQKKNDLDIVIFNDVCSFCKTNIIQYKYTCIICSNAILCEQCEFTHDHPTIKFKNIGMSTKLDVLDMLGFVNKLDHLKKEEDGVFKRFKDSIFGNADIYKAKLYIDFKEKETPVIRARPKKKFMIPIMVANSSKSSFPSETTIIVRNNLDLIHKIRSLDFELGSKGIMLVDLEFEAKELKEYDLDIFLYHREIKFEQDILKVKVEINDDYAEEEYDEFLKSYPKLRFISRQEKSILQTIKKEQLSDKDLMVIYFIMARHKWNIDSAIDELTS